MTTRLCSSLLTLLLVSGLLGPRSVLAQERVLGEEIVEPGIQMTFEAAPQDDVTPHDQNLSEEATDIHLEVLVGWTWPAWLPQRGSEHTAGHREGPRRHRPPPGTHVGEESL